MSPFPEANASSEPSYRAVLTKQAGFTCDVWELLVDMEFVMLYKLGRTARCIELVSVSVRKRSRERKSELGCRCETKRVNTKSTEGEMKGACGHHRQINKYKIIKRSKVLLF